jgi:transposase-like protein
MKVKQSIPKELRYSVRDFNNEFPHDSACLEYIKEQRWPNGVIWCVKCLKDTKHHRVGNRTAYACQSCGNHIYPLAGTVFEKSTTPLKTWFYAMYLMGSTRCGISAKQIQRETGVTYKTAWRMFRQIRSLLAESLQLEGSTVEMDEMFHGGSRRTSSWRENKVPVVGMVERGGRVVARVAANVKKETLHGLVKQYIMPSSVVFTDDFVSYDGLQNLGYTHRRIRHSERV